MSHQNLLNLSKLTKNNLGSNPEGIIVNVQNRNKRGRKSIQRDAQPLRAIRLSRDYTLEELAALTEMSPSYISRLESGTRRLNADSIKKLSIALQCNPNDLLSNHDKWGDIQGFFVNPNNYNVVGAKLNKNSAQIAIDGIVLYNAAANDDIIDLTSQHQKISCPPELVGIPGAFACVVNNNTMSPKYRSGDIVHIHPGKPLTVGAYIFLITTDAKVIIGEFMGWSNNNKYNAANDEDLLESYYIELKQYNPCETIKLAQSEISSMGRIVSSVEKG